MRILYNPNTNKIIALLRDIDISYFNDTINVAYNALEINEGVLTTSQRIDLINTFNQVDIDGEPKYTIKSNNITIKPDWEAAIDDPNVISLL